MFNSSYGSLVDLLEDTLLKSSDESLDEALEDKDVSPTHVVTTSSSNATKFSYIRMIL